MIYHFYPILAGNGGGLVGGTVIHHQTSIWSTPLIFGEFFQNLAQTFSSLKAGIKITSFIGRADAGINNMMSQNLFLFQGVAAVNYHLNRFAFKKKGRQVLDNLLVGGGQNNSRRF